MPPIGSNVFGICFMSTYLSSFLYFLYRSLSISLPAKQATQGENSVLRTLHVSQSKLSLSWPVTAGVNVESAKLVGAGVVCD